MTPHKVHLVGSMGLGLDVPATFRTVGQLLGARLQRVPDGEPGPRLGWMNWQYLVFCTNPCFTADESLGPITFPGFPLSGVMPLRPADGVDPGTIRFGELGYAREARASYMDFVAARKAGELAATARFQVCLPSPRIVVMAFCPGQAQDAVLEAYQGAMMREVAAICAAIPHRELCIQWDVPSETMVWDGRMRIPLDKNEVTARLAGLCAATPKDAEVGFHFCYGDPHNFRALEPADTGSMVAFANALIGSSARPITYIHMPVPSARIDEAYFKPLRGFDVESTELYLGMVHADGDDNMRKRLAAAGKFVREFGVAAECGLGRRPVKDVEALLAAHAHYAAA